MATKVASIPAWILILISFLAGYAIYDMYKHLRAVFSKLINSEPENPVPDLDDIEDETVEKKTGGVCKDNNPDCGMIDYNICCGDCDPGRQCSGFCSTIEAGVNHTDCGLYGPPDVEEVTDDT